MVVNEQQRRLLHQRLVDVLGPEEADALMEHLPPTGWGDVARRSDVDHATALMRADLDRSVAQLRAEMAKLDSGLRAEISRQGRNYMFGTIGSVIAMVGAMVGIANAFAH